MNRGSGQEERQEAFLQLLPHGDEPKNKELKGQHHTRGKDNRGSDSVVLRHDGKTIR
mgnify:CR=1 FL=1